MLTFIRSYTLTDELWTSNNLSQFIMSDVLTFKDVKVIIHTSLNLVEEVIVLEDFNKLVTKDDMSLTLSEWLLSLADDAITFSDRPIRLSTTPVVRWKPMADSGYTIVSNNYYSRNGLYDLQIQSPALTGINSLEHLANYSVFIANGKAFLTRYSASQGLYVISANRELTKDTLGDYSFGILDFTDVGTITQESLYGNENIKAIAQTDEEKANWKQRVIIDVDNPITGQRVIPVVSGIIDLQSKSIRQVSTTRFILTLDLKCVFKQVILNNPKNIKLDYFTAANISGGGLRIDYFDAVEFLKQTESFLVYLDNDKVKLYKDTLHNKLGYRTYLHNRYPSEPLVLEDGRIACHRRGGHNLHRQEILTIDNTRLDMDIDYMVLDDHKAISKALLHKTNDYQSLQAIALYYF